MPSIRKGANAAALAAAIEQRDIAQIRLSDTLAVLQVATGLAVAALAPHSGVSSHHALTVLADLHERLNLRLQVETSLQPHREALR